MEHTIQAAIAVGSYREALTLIAREHSSALLRFCYGIVGSPTEAEELTQDTLTQSFQSLPKYRADSSVRAWVFGIARKVCASHLRRRDRRAGIWAIFGGRGTPTAIAPPLEEAERSEERRLLAGALSSLKGIHREAVLLRYQAGLSSTEIATCLGISHVAARKRVSLGLAQLRQTLTPLLADAALRVDDSNHKESGHGPNTLRAG